ncbi:MAG: hypothetical protein WB780_00260 [Candidatus Acidiferrales bacterium]
MKTLHALLLSILLMATGAFAQQQAGSTQPDSKSVTTAKPAKKSVSKKKSRKEQKELKEQKEVAGEAEQDTLPPLLTERMKKFSQTVPVNGGLSGPGGLAHQEFLHRAYPDTKIPAERIEAARNGHAGFGGRGFGDDRLGPWESFGPSLALYPETPLRNFSVYVPNAYPAASRTTALALSSHCQSDRCTLWAGPAGGGIWRTRNALSDSPRWDYLSGSFQINAIGSIEMDPNDPDGDTLWVGTGEANSCGSGCEAGVGLYKSEDGGDHWQGPIGSSVFNERAIGSIVVKPGDRNTIYAATTQGLRGQSSVCCNGTIDLIPGAPKWGLYKSTDGGRSWTFIHNGSADVSVCTGDLNEAQDNDPCSPFGVRRVALDPSNPDIVYASSYARGVWRSMDAGATWTQISPSLDSTDTATRPEISVTTLPNGKTRMYLAEGEVGAPPAQLSRSDDVTTATPVFTVLTSGDPANTGYGSFNFCTGQCWYDSFVKTPPGNPDMVYLLGSYSYGETGNISNGRAVVLSTDAGVSFTDMTQDSTDPVQPHGIHPDEHYIVFNPSNPLQFWESSDGGIMRSSGAVADISANCSTRGLSGAVLARCQQLLSRVPTRLTSINTGLTTLQFQSLSVNPFDPNDVQGGTQDNGTWETISDTNHSQWNQTIFGDGGQSGFDFTNPQFRFHTYAGPEPDVNFFGGVTAEWNFIGDTFFEVGEASEFYFPIISDPFVHATMYAGMMHVYRTKTQGVGARTLAAFRANCNEFVGVDPLGTCGDWVALGDPSPNGELTGSDFGSDRSGIDVAAVARYEKDSGTLWAATAAGRVFISKNADAEPETSVVFTRLDSLASNSPGRFISSIFVDPNNGNRAWISYSGYNASTPSTPGHVFEVRYDPVAGTATFKDVSFDLPDTPITSVVRDEVTHDLFASSDFGVYRLNHREKGWRLAAPGMPNIEVAGLTLVPKAHRLFAASHGQGAWLLRLPQSGDDDDGN